MANITGRLTLDNSELLLVDSDPSAGGGTPAPVGSTASESDTGYEWIKVGSSDTDWQRLVPTNDALINTQNIVVVQKNPGVGQFLTIESALASITTNSITNPFLISVAPGIYNENPLTMKPYVAIKGSGDEETVINAINANANLITGVDFSIITDLQLTGVSGNGFASVYHNSLTGTTNTAFWIERVRFGSNNILVNCESTSGNSAVSVNSCKIGGTFSFITGFIANSLSGQPAKITIRDITTTGLSSPYPNDVFLAMGPGSELVLNGVQVRSGTITSGNGIRIRDGASARILSTSLKGFGTAVWTENVGNAPTIHLLAGLWEDNTIDIKIEHPGTMGCISGCTEETKVQKDFNAPLGMELIDHETGNLLQSGNLKLQQQGDGFVDITTLTTESSTMGVLEGGELSDGGGFIVNVANGFGYLEIKPEKYFEITWNNTSITLTANSNNYIYFDSTSTLLASSSLPDTKSTVLLGRVVTNSISIEFIDQSQLIAEHTSNRYDDFHREALGPVFANGCLVSETSPNTRQLTITNGVYFLSSVRYAPSSAINPTWIAYYGDGAGGWNRLSQNVVDNAFYDNGSGTLAPLSSSFYAKHSLYLVGDGVNQKFLLVYAQAQNANLTVTEQAVLSVPPNFFTDGVVLIASIIVQQGNSGLIEIRDERPRVGFKSSGTSANSFHSNLLGLTIGDDHTQYWRNDGTHIATGDFNLGTHNITNLGTANGVVVENHHARHQPGGADAIPTAAPITTLDPTTTNAAGTGTSLSRNDHTHAISTALTANISTIQPDDSASGGSSNTYARGDHKHAIVADPPSTLTPDQSNSEGVSTSFVRADHIHNIPTATAITLNANSTNTQGSNTSFARSDHTHAITSGTPTDIGSANTAGTASTFVRSDHVHKGMHSVQSNSGTQRFGDINLKNGLGATITDNGDNSFTIDTTQAANEFVITSTSGLTINYSGGRFVNGVNGQISNVPSGSVTVAANTTLGYLSVQINPLSNSPNVVFATTPPGLDSVPFAQYVSGSSTITSTTDIRSFVKTIPLSESLRITYPGSGLTISYNGGRVNINGTINNIAAGTLLLSNNIASGAIYVDPTTITVSANGTGIFPFNCVPLAIYTTNATVVTALNSSRSFNNNNIVFGSSGDIVTILPDVSAAAGTTNKYADAGHTHAIVTAAASSQTPNQANAKGSSISFARADHIHNIPTAAPANQTIAASASDGSAATFSRSDHLHTFTTASASTISSNANITGTSTSFTRADHTHQLTASSASLDHLPQFDGSNWQPVYPEATRNPSHSWRIYDEFMAGNNGGANNSVGGDLNWLFTKSGAAGAMDTNNAAVTSSHPGVIKLISGNAGGNFASMLLGGIILGNGALELEAMINLDALATVTNDWTFRIGLGDQGGADHNNGVYFEYTRATSTNWLIKTANGGTRTSTTTSTAVAATSWINLHISINAAASSITYLINGSSVGTITTNIPTAVTQFSIQQIRSAGTPTGIDLDYFLAYQRFTSSR